MHVLKEFCLSSAGNVKCCLLFVLRAKAFVPTEPKFQYTYYKNTLTYMHLHMLLSCAVMYLPQGGMISHTHTYTPPAAALLIFILLLQIDNLNGC